MVTLTRPPAALGSHATGLRRLATSPFRQSPYIFGEERLETDAAGILVAAGGATFGPSG